LLVTNKYYSTTNDNNWYRSKGWYAWTHSWSVAANQVNFQILHNPGGDYGNFSPLR
jgi:hypothetical protein